MQITAIAWLVYNVFNELLVCCKIKMWTIKAKPLVEEPVTAKDIVQDANNKLEYKEMNNITGDTQTEPS